MKNKTLITVIFVIIAVIGSLVAFLLVKNKDAIFWISYAFSLIAVIGVYLSATHLSEGKFKCFSAEFSFTPITFWYLIAEVIVIVLFGGIMKTDTSWYFSIHIVVLAICVIATIVLIMGRRTIIGVSESTQANVLQLKMLCVDVEQLDEKVNAIPAEVRANAQRMLHNLADKIRYSDPMAHESLKGIDNDICKKVHNLGPEIDRLIETKTYGLESFASTIKTIDNMLEDRNKRSKILK